MILPYVYQGTNPETGEFYIGARWANSCRSEDDLGIVYKTSSDKVKPRFHEFEWVIVAEFFKSEDAYDFEQELIYENIDNPLLLNGACFHLKSRFMGVKKATLKTRQKLSSIRKGKPPGNAGKPVSPETRAKKSVALKGRKMPPDQVKKLSESHIGLTHTNDTKEKLSNISFERERQRELSLSRDNRRMPIITPYGIFPSKNKAMQKLGISSAISLDRWLAGVVITKSMVSSLKCSVFSENDIGKTTTELGWSYMPS